jgi:hypothetical protein
MMEISRSTSGRETNFEENYNIKHNKTMKGRAPTVKMEGPMEGWNTPNVA